MTCLWIIISVDVWIWWRKCHFSVSERKTLTSIGCVFILHPSLLLFVCLSLFLLCSHTQTCWGPQLKPAVVMLTIVWWSTKNNSSQKKIVAGAAFVCPPNSCPFFCHPSTISVFSSLAPSELQVSFVVVEAEQSGVGRCFSNMDRKRAKLAAVSQLVAANALTWPSLMHPSQSLSFEEYHCVKCQSRSKVHKPSLT